MAHATGKEKTTLAGNKNRWATQWGCFYDAQTLYGRPFKLDVCAEPATSKCERFYVSPDWFNSRCHHQRCLVPHIDAGHNRIVGFDSLQGQWENDWWCNPPFDDKVAFIRKAVEQARSGKSGMLLIPYEPTVQWFINEVKPFATIIYEPDGRYNFMEVDGVTKKTGANFPCCLVLFTSHFTDKVQIVPFNRGIGNVN